MGLKYSTFDSHIVYLEIGTFDSHFIYLDIGNFASHFISIQRLEHLLLILYI